MKNKELALKIKELRSRKGYSQEELADKTGLSLRTIQRIENGETEPRGYSLKRLAIIFDVLPDEIVDWTVRDDNGFLVSLNLSALLFIFSPLLGILVPTIIWISKKDKIRDLNETAKKILNFQITWTIILLICWIVPIFNMANKISEGFSPKIITSSLLSQILLFGFMYLYNIAFIIINSIRINRGKRIRYFPSIRFIK